MRFLYISPRFLFFWWLTLQLAISQVAIAQKNEGFIADTSGKFPATGYHFNDDCNILQFAIVSDLWGDYRKGVFEDAVSKIELLQPQFVMSVGDLTDGKTYDSSVMDLQWLDFNRKLRPLTMPFFYVPGNHDIGNPVMEKEWQRRFGRAYYYFVYKNVLFLCVNTQDGGRSSIGQEQIDYFRKAINDHPDVRWTFIFMHRPVWFTESEKEEGFEKIESAFRGDHYTLFSGHFHTYLSNTKNGYKHYILGSTGGGSDLRGEKFGEYDHITWVTLSQKDPPKIVNLKLSGIIKEDVVNEKTYPITNTLIDQTWLVVPPYVSGNRFEKSISPFIIFNNPTPYTLQVKGNMPAKDGMLIYPEKIGLRIAPHSNKRLDLLVTSAGDLPLDIQSLPGLSIHLTGSYLYDTLTYELPAVQTLKLEWQQSLPITTNAAVMAKKYYQQADTTGFITIDTPGYLKNKWYWQGPNDGLISFLLQRDARYLYVNAVIKDDQLVMDGTSGQRDIVYLQFEDKSGVPAFFNLTPDSRKSMLVRDPSASLLTADDIQWKCEAANHEIKIWMRVAVSSILKTDRTIRFNIGYRDQDNHPEKEYATFFWKPVWGTSEDYANSGSFILSGDTLNAQ